MHMTAMKLVATAALLLGTTLAMSITSFAQAIYDSPPGYGYTPGYGYAPRFGYADLGLYSFAQYYDFVPGIYDSDYPPGVDGFSPNNCVRGGPGPRVGCGQGTGIGADR